MSNECSQKSNGNGGMKVVVGVLASAVTTGAYFWFAFGTGVATRAELEKIEVRVRTDRQIIDLIDRHAPYLADRAMIAASLSQNSSDIRALTEEVNKLVRDQAVLIAQIGQLLQTN